MIQKIASNEYLKRADNMSAAERNDYTERVGEWLEKQAPLLMPKMEDEIARYQNVVQCSMGWNDIECKAWTEGVRLLSALVPTADTWLPDMLYVKSAKRAIRQMHGALAAVSGGDAGQEDGVRMMAGSAKEALMQEAKEEPAVGKAAIKREQNGTGSDSAEREQARPEVNRQQAVAPFQNAAGDGNIGGGNNEREAKVTPVPARPKHIDQYVHLLPKKTQERAAMYGPLMRELDVAREKTRLLMDDPKASASSREQWAKTITKIDGQIKSIKKELDAEWDKLAKSGRVVVDDFGNAHVSEECRVKSEESEALEPAELTSEQRARRRELRKWLIDTRRGNGNAREARVEKWYENFREYLTLEGDAAFEDAKIKEAIEHYGINLAFLEVKSEE